MPLDIKIYRDSVSEESGESCSMNLGLCSNNEESGENCSMNLGLNSKRK